MLCEESGLSEGRGGAGWAVCERVRRGREGEGEVPHNKG